MKKINFQKEAKKAFLLELEEMRSFSSSKDFNVQEICDAIFQCKGKIFLTGVGKSGHIANKISATLSSTGTPSFFIHPAEALHGDLGMIQKKDLILAISKSGESKEVCDLIPAIKFSKIKHNVGPWSIVNKGSIISAIGFKSILNNRIYV